MYTATSTEFVRGEYVIYSSAVMESDRTYGLVLPPGYDQHPNQHYPVIFMLHGGHGQASDWLEKGSAAVMLERLYQEEKLPPSIVIMPDATINADLAPTGTRSILTEKMVIFRQRLAMS